MISYMNMTGGGRSREEGDGDRILDMDERQLKTRLQNCLQSVNSINQNQRFKSNRKIKHTIEREAGETRSKKHRPE